MDKNVDMEYEGPIFYKRGVQFMKIVVGPEFNKSRNIYLASGNRAAQVLKMFNVFISPSIR